MLLVAQAFKGCSLAPILQDVLAMGQLEGGQNNGSSDGS